MAIRLRDRQSMPWMQPGGKLITMSSVAMKWTGLLLTCLSSFGAAILQRGLLKLDSYASLDDLLAAAPDPASGAMSLVSWTITCSLISTMAIPLYAKLLYEGWKRAASRKPLLKRLALCALLSDLPFNLAMNGAVLDFDVQCPVWGLLVCAIMLEVLRMPRPQSRIMSGLVQVLTVAGALAWTLLLRIYMGPTMVLLVAMFYFLEGHKLVSTLGGAMLTMPQFPAPLGMLFAYWYEPNEEKDTKFPNLFYFLYPAQLLVFGIVGMLLAGLTA